MILTKAHAKKQQIATTLPAAIARHLGVAPGDLILWIADRKGAASITCATKPIEALQKATALK